MGNLPLRATDIVGRSDQIAAICRLLQRERLVTLLGPPGSGKTTLALESARCEETAFPSGAWLLDLASVETAESLVPTFAAALGVGSAADPLAAVVARLNASPTLVVLDNCEHIVDEVARASASCLAGSPSVTLLATSRRAISIAGETLYDVEPLAVRGSSDEPDLESPAVRLFVLRASQQRASLTWNRDELEAAWTICARLDGLPLAIELAAARCRILSPQQLLVQLEREPGTLASDRRDISERHRSLNASIEWSWRLLAPEAADLLARLSVFPGDFPFEAAVAVSDEPPSQPFLRLRELVDSSLLSVTTSGSQTRYRLLDSIRAYGARQLERSGREQAVRDRVLEWCRTFAEAASHETSADAAIDVFAAELPTLRVAIDQALTTDAGSAAVAIAARTYRLWETRQVREGITIAARLLSASLGWSERADALLFGARLAAFAGDVMLCATWAQEAVDLARAHADPVATGAALRVLARATRWVGDPSRALALFDEAIALLEDGGATTELIDCYTGIADLSMWMGDPARARAAAAAALDFARADGDRPHLLRALFYAGAIDHARGHIPAAERALREAASIADDLDEQVLRQLVRGWTARMGAYRGTFEESLALARSVIQESARSNLIFARFAGEWATAHLLYESGARDIDVELLEQWAAALAAIQFPAFAAEMLWIAAATKRRRAGNADEAAALLTRAQQQAQLPHGRFMRGRVMLLEAMLAADRGATGEAFDLVYSALHEMKRSGDGIGLLQGLEDAAALVVGRSPSFALQLLTAVAAERQRLGIIVPPVRIEVVGSITRAANAQRTPIPAGASSAPVLSVEDAIHLLSRKRGRRRAVTSGWRSLTPSELAVAREIAAGRRTAEIASRLGVAPTTVKTHVAHIFDKLGVRTRARIAALTTELDGRAVR